MRILFNCTNNSTGGSVQNAANFIRYASADKSHKFLFLVSLEVYALLRKWNINVDNVLKFDRKRLFSHLNKDILRIESTFNPDIVYTMAGPTYINFHNKHIMGISDGYITHARLPAFYHNRHVTASCKMLIKTGVKGLYARNSADYFIFQTETARNGFCRRYFLSINKTAIIPNAVGEAFLANPNSSLKNRHTAKTSNSNYYIVCPSAYYSHKDIEILFKACSLNNFDNNIKFIITIKNTDYQKLIKQWPKSKYKVINIGPYSYDDAISIYNMADAVILPSFLETFSTTYIEAIALHLPLIVADESFSKEICGGYAYYFKSRCAESLNKLLLSPPFKTISDYQIKESKRILDTYGSQYKRYNSIIHQLENFKDL